jgi:hypothetical protein
MAGDYDNDSGGFGWILSAEIFRIAERNDDDGNPSFDVGAVKIVRLCGFRCTLALMSCAVGYWAETNLEMLRDPGGATV